MKTLLVLTTLLFLNSPSFAQTTPDPILQCTRAPARDLQLVMQELGAQFKIIKTQINDASLNATTTSASQALAPLLIEAMSIAPDMVMALPVEKQHLQMLVYQKLLLQVSVANIDLETALTNGDQASAIAAFTQMGQLIASGHSIFR